MIELALLLIYCIVGCIIAVPYTFLASGGTFCFAWTTMLAPLIIITIFPFWFSGKKWGSILFWAILTYFMLPPIFNGASHLFTWINFPTISRCLFATRFLILIVPPVILFVADWVQTIAKRSKGYKIISNAL